MTGKPDDDGTVVVPEAAHQPSIWTRLARTVRLTSRTNMFVIGVSYSIFAVSLIFQPSRWSSTPAYHNLLIIMPQQAWGAGFAVVAVMLGAALWKWQHRWVSTLALSLGLAISTTWDAAFVIRWLTSSSTTPETWVSWTVFDFLLLWALLFLPHEGARTQTTRSDDGG